MLRVSNSSVALSCFQDYPNPSDFWPYQLERLHFNASRRCHAAAVERLRFQQTEVDDHFQLPQAISHLSPMRVLPLIPVLAAFISFVAAIPSGSFNFLPRWSCFDSQCRASPSRSPPQNPSYATWPYHPFFGSNFSQGHWCHSSRTFRLGPRLSLRYRFTLNRLQYLHPQRSRCHLPDGFDRLRHSVGLIYRRHILGLSLGSCPTLWGHHSYTRLLRRPRGNCHPGSETPMILDNFWFSYFGPQTLRPLCGPLTLPLEL